MQYPTSLNEQPNTNVKPGYQNRAVHDALTLMGGENFTAKNRHDTEVQQISDLFTQGFEIHDPTGAKKINSKMLIQWIWKWIGMVNVTDFDINGSGKDDTLEYLVTEGMTTVLTEGGFDRTFRGKGGVLFNSLMYGDGYRMINVNEEDGFPVSFTPITQSNIYFNVRATGFRNTNKPVTRCAVVYSGTWNEFISLYPKAAKIAGIGQIPRNFTFLKESDMSYQQTYNTPSADTVIEWCYYWDLDHQHYVLFAGSQCTVIEEKKGKDWVWNYTDSYNRKNPYIPISNYSIFPAAEGMYNYGIGQYVYDVAKFYNGLSNLMGAHVENNVFSPRILSIPQGQSANFMRNMQMSYQERALGQTPYIPVEASATSSNAVGLSQMTVPVMFNELIAAWDNLEKNLTRLGYYPDGIENTSKTAFEERLNYERASQPIKTIMQMNALETRFEIEVAMDLVKKCVRSTDKTPLNITSPVKYDGEMKSPSSLTLGNLKNTLKNGHWFVNMQTKKVDIPSDTIKMQGIQELLPFLPPGSPAFNKAAKQAAALKGIEFEEVDVMPPQVPGAPTVQGAAQPPQQSLVPTN